MHSCHTRDLHRARRQNLKVSCDTRSVVFGTFALGGVDSRTGAGESLSMLGYSLEEKTLVIYPRALYQQFWATNASHSVINVSQSLWL